MFKQNKFIAVLLLFTLVFSVCPAGTVFAAEPDFMRGSSLVAGDQNAAASGMNYDGLDIAWLDLGSGTERVGITEHEFDGEVVYTLHWYSSDSERRVVVDKEGTVLVPTGYDVITPVAADLFYVSILTGTVPKAVGELSAGGNIYTTSIIDKDGREATIGEGLTQRGAFREGLVRVSDENSKLGFADEAGNLVIPCKYHIAYDFSEGYAATYDSETHLWAHIDKTGKLLTERKFSHAESFQEGLALVREEGVYKYLDQQGQVAITLEGAQSAQSFCNGLAVVEDANGKYGYIDKTGSYVIQPIFDGADDFTGLVTPVNYRDMNGEFIGQALIDRTGKRVTPVGTYTFFEGLGNDMVLSCDIKSNLMGYLNQYGSEAVPFLFERATPFRDGTALVLPDENSQYVGILKKPQEADLNKGNGMISVEVNGKAIDFHDVDPVSDNGRVLVPMRAIFEALGAEVGWDGPTQTVTGMRDGISVKLTLGVNDAEVNGSKVTLDVPAKLVNGRTMVPIRFITESFSGTADWLPAESLVKITL